MGLAPHPSPYSAPALPFPWLEARERLEAVPLRGGSVRSPGPVSSHSPPEGTISLPPGLIYLTPHTCAPTHHFPAGLNHRGLFRHLTPVPLSGKITHTHMCVCSLFSQHYVAVWGVLFLIIVLFLPVGFLFIKEPKLTCIWTQISVFPRASSLSRDTNISCSSWA